MAAEFLGYPRPQGPAGIRNQVVLLPVTRFANQLAWQIGSIVAGTTVWLNPGELGRHRTDRERLQRVMLGLVRNPNVYGAILCGVRPDFGYAENRLTALMPAFEAMGKTLEVLLIEEEGGMQQAAARGIAAARELVWQASQVRRAPVSLAELTLGLKCGHSDATSGLAGNPVLGKAVDRLIAAGGTVIFSETTEVIGAEQSLAARAAAPDIAASFLGMVERHEAKIKAIGQDIRSVNPIPSNIAAGLTTLEEKSLGAVAKTGKAPLAGVIEYAEAPSGSGLWFMDGWMSSFSLPMSLAAAGAQLVIYQFGGDDLPMDAPMPATNTGVVAPLFFTTGNPRTAKNAHQGLDFDASAVISEGASLDETGATLLARITDVASGTLTRGETVRFSDPVEVNFDGPYF